MYLHLLNLPSNVIGRFPLTMPLMQPPQMLSYSPALNSTLNFDYTHLIMKSRLRMILLKITSFVVETIEKCKNNIYDLSKRRFSCKYGIHLKTLFYFSQVIQIYSEFRTGGSEYFTKPVNSGSTNKIRTHLNVFKKRWKESTFKSNTYIMKWRRTFDNMN